MATNISPGVYTKIVDISAYVAAVPGTIGMVCALTKKGEDNVLKLVSSRADLIAEYGEPNIQEYGKNYGQGLYIAYNFLGESGNLYFCRCMPDDAAFANIRIDVDLGSSDATAAVQTSYLASTNANTINELKTNLEASGDISPLCVLRPIGRGEYYNSLSVRFTEVSNPLLTGVYVMDVYEKQSDGSEVIIESFECSFDPNAADLTGDSIFLPYVLEQYSAVLRCEMKLMSDAYTSGYELIAKVYDKNIGSVSVTDSDATASNSATLVDTKQDFSDWESTSYPLTYCVKVKDGKGNTLTGWLGASSGTDNDTIAIYDSRLVGGNQNWIGGSDNFNNPSGEITYEVRKCLASVADGFTSSDPVPFKKGSEGSLLTASGDFNSTGTGGGKDCLADGYTGTLVSKTDGSSYVDDVLDTENIYFSLVFDAGYHKDVKTQMVDMVMTRRDCVAILDNGHNTSTNAALTARQDDHPYNTFYAAIYESYNKVYDTFTGQDVLFSPIYHMSYLLPRNDNVAELWYAVAGFNRATIQSIKELEFNPRLGDRDSLYQKQINPLVKFNPGYVPWGQLTTQAKASAMQDLNIVRLYLYCKRALEEFCRYFIFEQNDAITWGQVSGAIVEFLEDVKKRRGLYGYSVEVGATAYEIKRKTFHCNVLLRPTRVVEKIDLNFYIE